MGLNKALKSVINQKNSFGTSTNNALEEVTCNKENLSSNETGSRLWCLYYEDCTPQKWVFLEDLTA